MQNSSRNPQINRDVDGRPPPQHREALGLGAMLGLGVMLSLTAMLSLAAMLSTGTRTHGLGAMLSHTVMLSASQ